MHKQEIIWLAGNFTEKDLGKPILDTVLDPGDLLYFPRGTIHQVKHPCFPFLSDSLFVVGCCDGQALFSCRGTVWRTPTPCTSQCPATRKTHGGISLKRWVWI